MLNIDYHFAFVFVYVATYIFVALYCSVVLLRTRREIGRRLEVMYFRFVVTALFIYCITESIWAVGAFGYSQTIDQFNLPLTIVNSILVNAFCYFWFCYMESYLQSEIMNRRRWRIFVFIPFGIAILLTLTTPLTGWIFYIDSAGEIERGPLYIAIIILAYAYAAVTTIRAAYAALKTTDRQRRAELLTMTAFVIPPAVVGVIDTLYPLMPIVAPAFFFSFLIVFTMLQEGQISSDSLTGLNNRRRAEAHFDTILKTATEKSRYLFFIIDANGFKKINDTYGHLEGDQALCIIANALRDSCRNSGAFLARWGGDEFVVMVAEEDVNSPEDFIDLIDDCLRYEAYNHQLPYILSVTVGWAYFTGAGQSKRRVLEAADKILYEKKRQRAG